MAPHIYSMKNLIFYGSLAFSLIQATLAQTFTINEIDTDTPGSDTMEFIEIFDGGVGNSSLDGLVLVLVNGNGELTYNAFDLDGFSTDANGFFVAGNPDVPNVGLVIPPGGSGVIQNGADAVALYLGDATEFPNGTDLAALVPAREPIDAIVYGTNDADDPELLALFGGAQQDEFDNGDNARDSIQRNPDGGTTFVVDLPTPGTSNNLLPRLTLSLSATSIIENAGAGAIEADVTLPAPTQEALTIEIIISDNTAITGPTTVTIPAGEDFTFFSLDAVNDNVVDGLQMAEVTIRAVGFRDSIPITVNVADDDLAVPAVVINELQRNGSEGPTQFVELFNGEDAAVDLTGWTIRAFGSSAGAAFGTVLGAVDLPSISLGANDFYLVGNAAFASLYGITPDLLVEPEFATGDVTIILFDADGNVVFSVLSVNNVATDFPNNAGAAIVPTITLEPDGFASAAGFFLQENGGGVASNLEFAPQPSNSATPGFSNLDFVQRLRIAVDNDLISEAAGVGAATATVTRVNNFDGPLTVSLVSSDPSELVFQQSTLEFADGETELTVLLDAVDDNEIDGLQSVTLTVTGGTLVAGTDAVGVTDDDAPIANLVINEVLIDTAGLDTEFVEIFNAGTTAVDLAGYSFEKWDSDAGALFGGVDGGGPFILPTDQPIILEAGGYFLMANAPFAAVPEYSGFEVDFTFQNNGLENGSATFVLRDSNANVVHTVFATDGGVDDLPNIAGVTIVPDAIGNDTGFALLPDGDSSNVVEIDNGVPSIDATPGFSNGTPPVVIDDYSVTLGDMVFANGQFTINFTATGTSDVYVTTDLVNFTLATNGNGVVSGSYVDTAPPAGRAFYLIQEAGAAPPNSL